MASSWGTQGGSDWSQPSGWIGQGRGGQIAPAGGMFGAAVMPPGGKPWWGQQAGGGMAGAAVMPQGGGMFGASASPQFTGQPAPGMPPGWQLDATGQPWSPEAMAMQQAGGGGMLSAQGAGAGGQMPQAYAQAQVQPPPARAGQIGAQQPTLQAPGGQRRAAAQPNALPFPFNPGGDGGGGGGLFGGKQTIEQTFNPWGPQGEGLKKLYGKAEAEYARQKALGGPKFSQESAEALQRMENMAKGPNRNAQSAMNAVGDITSGRDSIGTGKFEKLYGDTGFTNEQTYKNMTNQNAITNSQQYNQLYNQMNAPGSLERGMFNQIAQGNLVDANPHREQNIKQSMGDTAKMVKASMSKAGRYGSDAYGDAMGKALSSVATQAREAGYNQDTANMMAAAQARSGENLGMAGLGLQSAQGLSSAQAQNQAQKFAALQGLTGMQGQRNQAQMQAAMQLANAQGQNIQNRMGAAGMAPEMQKLRYDDMNRLLGIGASKEAMTEQQRNFGWQNLQQLQGMYGGLPGQAGQSQQSTQEPWWKQAAGLGMFGLGMFGGM